MTIPVVAFLGGSIGGWELLVVGVVVLIFFGPKGLPEIAKTIGRLTAQLRGAAQDFRDQMDKAADEQSRPPSLPQGVKEPGEPAASSASEKKPGDPLPDGAAVQSSEEGDTHGRAG